MRSLRNVLVLIAAGLVSCAAIVVLYCSSTRATEELPQRTKQNEGLKQGLELDRSLATKTSPPVGSVIAFWGSQAELKAMEPYYELCDGTPVRALGSPLHGRKKPDLIDRFVMGVQPAGSANLLDKPVSGGRNTTANIDLKQTDAHTLTEAQIPSHAHPHRHKVVAPDELNAAVWDNNRETGRDGKIAAVGTDGGGDAKYSTCVTGREATKGDTSQDQIAAGGGGGHSHGLPNIPEQENRPAYIGLYYIVRVK